jgi:hypothetical protein
MLITDRSVAPVGVDARLGTDEDPRILPRPTGHVPLDVQPGHALQRPCGSEGAGIDRSEPDRLDDIEDRLLRGRVITGNESVRRDPGDGRLGLTRRKDGVEGLHDPSARDPTLELLGDRGGRAIGRRGRAVGDVDDDLAVDGTSELARDLFERLRRNRQPTSSADDAAWVFVVAAVAPVSLAASAAWSGWAAEMVTWWPARVSEDASARPTLPAPMMAICMSMILRDQSMT